MIICKYMSENYKLMWYLILGFNDQFKNNNAEFKVYLGVT